MDRLAAKSLKTSRLIRQAAINATQELVDIAEGNAISNLQSSVKHGSGELSSSLKQEVVEDNDSKKIVGRLWTDKKQGIFREFGTGPVGEASTKQLPTHIVPVYTQTPWFIPASEAPELDTLYGMIRLTIQGVDYFRTSGQPARPWLFPALLQAQEMAETVTKEHIQKALKGL